MSRSVKEWIRVNLLRQIAFQATAEQGMQHFQASAQRGFVSGNNVNEILCLLKEVDILLGEAIDGLFTELLLHHTVKTQPSSAIIIASNHQAFQQRESFSSQVCTFQQGE